MKLLEVQRSSVQRVQRGKKSPLKKNDYHNISSVHGEGERGKNNWNLGRKKKKQPLEPIIKGGGEMLMKIGLYLLLIGLHDPISSIYYMYLKTMP